MIGAVAQYTFMSWRPPAHHMAADEHPDHKFGYTKRTDNLTPGKPALYKAACTCKWKDPDEAPFTSRRIAKARWNRHMREALAQTELFGYHDL